MPSSYIWSITFSELFPFYHFSQKPVFLVLKVSRLLSSDKWWCTYTEFSTCLLEFNSLRNAMALRNQALCFFGFGIREERHPALVWDFNIWFRSIFWLSQAQRKQVSWHATCALITRTSLIRGKFWHWVKQITCGIR